MKVIIIKSILCCNDVLKVFFFMLTFMVVSVSFANEKLNTQYGNIEITGTDCSSRGVISINKSIIFDSECQYIGFYDRIDTEKNIIILFGVNPGGSATPSSQLYFLILNHDNKFQVLTAKGFDSFSEKIEITRSYDGIEVDLGFESKRKKQAKLQDNKVFVEYTPILPPQPMPEEKCKWLHEYSSRECIEDNKNDNTKCNEYADNYSGMAIVNMTGITILSHHPGFINSAFAHACLQACKTGMEIPFSEFKKEVCSIK